MATLGIHEQWHPDGRGQGRDVDDELVASDLLVTAADPTRFAANLTPF